MAIAEIFIGAFITVLFEKLFSADLIRLARSAGIYSELIKWNDTLSQIQAVLVDAGHKHITQTAVQTWLNKLQQLAYDIDDVLDDLTTEAMRHHLNEESSANTSTKISISKALNIIPAKFHALKYGHKMSHKLHRITTKLRDLVEEKNILGLINNVERSNNIASSRRLEETSLVDVSRIIGRERDKEKLLKKLLGNESCSRNFSVVSIVGLGGIGKTTLAQVLYNDTKVKTHFELMSWVCASDEFDIFKISKAIFQAVGGGNQEFANLNLLQVALAENLSNKRFLLVLDDVWNENYMEWELLQRPFVVGAPGSKIIVTTRKTIVASVMDSVRAYHLELLSNNEALSLFAHHALGKQNFDSHPALKLPAESIVKNCGGLPLALITIGRMLRTKTNDRDWEELSGSEIWNIATEGSILPALRLSYYDLPPHLKQMFAYCCLFPKDYAFHREELVLLWMAEGFLYEPNGSKSMESLGRECFEELVSRSFFQHLNNQRSRYTMHDLINDMAMSVAQEFFFTLSDKMDVENKNKALERFRHFSFIRERYGMYRRLKALQKARRLRTLLAVSVKRFDDFGRFYLSSKVLTELLPQLEFLRVLSLTNYNITEVPQSIGSLKHLRYLNFSKTDITCLPEQVGDLYNLQSLLLFCCRKLLRLPNSCEKLINLRHLDISDTPKLKEMPLAFGKLSGLQTLSKVIIGEGDGFKISELKSLPNLQGQLSIEGLHNVTNAIHAKGANLQQKKGLHKLEMEWSDVFDGSRNEITEYEVLEGLRPFEKLTSLNISNYVGTKFPSWIGDPSFVHLTQLTLRGCRSCTCLPSIGNLQSLQKLFVESMNDLKSVGSELLGNTDSYYRIAFPSLEVLEFKDMEGWEEWSANSGGKGGYATLFPCLREISIVNCQKLDVVAIELIPSLRVLHIKGCSVAVLRSMVCLSSFILRLTMENVKGLTQLDGYFSGHLRAIESLHILKCDELTFLWESEAKAWEILVSLQKLVVHGCVNLLSLGEKRTNLLIGKECCREVEIHDCPRLESYNCPNSVEKLTIFTCRSMISLTFPTMHGLPCTLKSLRIGSCDNLQADWLICNFVSSLESLSVDRMPNLRLFPGKCLVHLTVLKIWNCDNIKSIPDKGYGFFPFLCLRVLQIRNCKNLESFPHEHLQSLTSLEELWILDCPSMNYFFPCGLWPPNLSKLVIGGLKKPISEWGMQNFPTSLIKLYLQGINSGLVSFVESEDVRNSSSNTSSSSFYLPTSLTSLEISDFKDLESISKGMKHLTCLKKLEIWSCPKLIDLPETLLPSLSCLKVGSSPKLRKKCDCKKGKYWPVISQIPELKIRE